MSQATRPPFSRSFSGAAAIGADAIVEAGKGASLTRRLARGPAGSRHALQSILAQTRALSRVAAASAICTHAITTRSRDDGLESSS